MSDSLTAKLDALALSVEYPCNYLPGLLARQQHFYWPPSEGTVSGAFYQRLMDARFRRSGRLFYRPVCDSCSRCIPIRLRVAEFQPSESQRRSVKKNPDVTIEWVKPTIDDERIALYARYGQQRHDAAATRDTATELEQFLYDSPTDTVESVYRVDGKIIAIGICDLTPDALSSVYFYFEPTLSKRSLGVYSALQEIAYTAETARPYYYLGYWVEGCRKMDYKAAFADHELLVDGVWEKHVRRL